MSRHRKPEAQSDRVAVSESLTISQERLDEARNELVAEIARPLQEFVNVEPDELNNGVLFAAVANAEGKSMSEDDMGKVLAWAHTIQRQVCLLHFVLIGAVEVRVIDGALNFRMPGGKPDEMMRQLFRNGMVKS